MHNIIIIGARGYKSNYGGWETFVTNLIRNYKDKKTKFHVPELTHEKGLKNQILFKDNVSCPEIYVKDLGFITMFIYAIKALQIMPKYIKDNNLKNVVIYILGCRMGPFYRILIAPLKKMGAKIYLNPDGLEWKREKWSWWIKKCFKISEKCMVKNSDLIICDSKAIQDYIDKTYQKYHKKTTFIAYGAYLNPLINKAEEITSLLQKYHIEEHNYYLVVGRFVPENNYELIIKEFMKTKTKKDLIIVSNMEENKFYQQLITKTNFLNDKRIKFIGPVYDKNTLNYLRKNAYAYIHGHSAGGTNPSLLEALSLTSLNILYNAVYNVEVGSFSSLYFSKKEDDLKRIIEKTEKFSSEEILKYDKLAKERIKECYTWDIVVKKYQKIW